MTDLSNANETVSAPSTAAASVAPVSAPAIPSPPTDASDTASVNTSDLSTTAALANIAAGNPVPEAPATQASTGTNDSNPSTEQLQLQFTALSAQVFNLELMLQSYFAKYHRTEGYLNDDGSLNYNF